jgi:F0F1-type ATP synthase membrane subunit b/b'
VSDIIDNLLKRAQEIARDKAGHSTWREDARLLEQAAKEIESLRKQMEKLVRGE